MSKNQPTYHNDVLQGSDEWHQLRCGVITASVVGKLLTSKFKPADNATSRGLIAELAAQRITEYVEPGYYNEAMQRGHRDEILARALYSERYAPATETGIVTLKLPSGHTVAASPDGIIGDDGLIEVKSRAQKFQLQTILDGEAPEEYLAQIQMQLMVTGREWCDFISWCGGMPMFVRRVRPDQAIMGAIMEAIISAETEITRIITEYELAAFGLCATEREVEHGDEIF